MYRYSNGQISLADFKQPVGMNLKESNRWVKKAQTIPWPEIEKRYAALFTNRKGFVPNSHNVGLSPKGPWRRRTHKDRGVYFPFPLCYTLFDKLKKGRCVK